MNPGLLPSSYPVTYSLTGDPRYQPQDRQYSHNGLNTNGFLDRKHEMSTGPLSQSMSLSGPGGMLDYSAGQVQHENVCHTTNSQLMLTPPQSGDEATSTAPNTSPGPLPFSTNQSRLSTSNASTPDFYTSTNSAPYMRSFNGTGMTNFEQSSLRISAPLSPPYINSTGYVPSTFNSGSFPSVSSLGRPGMDLSPFAHRGGNSWADPYRTRPAFPQASFPPSTGLSHSVMASNPQRVEGPDFDDIERKHTLANAHKQNLLFDLNASIPKGFFKVDGKWTCYRRNYFTVSCGMWFKNSQIDQPVFLSRYSQLEQVHTFAVSIAAKTAPTSNSESEMRSLVQHTPKRDKATESTPGRHSVIPAFTSVFTSEHTLAHGGLYPPTSHMNLRDTLEGFDTPTNVAPGPNYTFERIQFQKATQNNGKRRAAQQYFQVVVKLEVNIGRVGGPDDWVLVATKTSHPMIVRGRSPGHYKDNRRDSQTGIDPDAGAGHGVTDGIPSNYSLAQVGHSHASLGNTSLQYRNGQYHASYSHNGHHHHDTDHSSMSPSSSTTLESSPTKGNGSHLIYSPGRSSHAEDRFDRVTLSPILSKTSSDLMDYQKSDKRHYEDHESGCTGAFYNSGMTTSFHNPAFDFSATSATQPLCTST